MEITFQELLNENMLEECRIWYFDLDEIRNEITIIFELPSYRSALFFRMIVLKNVKYYKFLGRLYDKPITYEFFMSWVKELKVEIEFADILKKFNERYSLQFFLGSFAMQFDCDKTIRYERRAFWPSEDGMCRVNETGDVISLKNLGQTEEFYHIFLKPLADSG